MKRTIRLLLVILVALTLPLRAANELTAALNLNFTKNGAALQRYESGSVTVTGSYISSGIATVSTSDGTLPLGDVGTIGFVYLKNLDGTNYITVGPDGSSYPIKLKPGEWCLVRWNSAAIHRKANSSACKLEYAIVED